MSPQINSVLKPSQNSTVLCVKRFLKVSRCQWAVVFYSYRPVWQTEGNKESRCWCFKQWKLPHGWVFFFSPGLHLHPLADTQQAKNVFNIQDGSCHNLAIVPKSIPAISLKIAYHDAQIKFTIQWSPCVSPLYKRAYNTISAELKSPWNKESHESCQYVSWARVMICESLNQGF